MSKDFRQIEWNAELAEEWQRLIQLAVREDLDRHHDWTTLALVGDDVQAEAAVVARQEGVVAGLPAAEMALHEFEPQLEWNPKLADGELATSGSEIAVIHGPARPLLTAERLLLNVIGHLSGIATLTRRYVEAIRGTKARIYDTRKTTPGWRRLEKYAVRLGGGSNHRAGLHEAILIKDNHLALGTLGSGHAPSAAEAVALVRKFIGELAATDPHSDLIVEIEIDSPQELESVLAAGPDIVLLDNMIPDQLHEAVAVRDRLAPDVELEASGGIGLETVREIALTGVERISVGAVTHSALWLDVGLDLRTRH